MFTKIFSAKNKQKTKRLDSLKNDNCTKHIKNSIRYFRMISNYNSRTIEIKERNNCRKNKMLQKYIENDQTI